jgi:hypothetical protein
MWRGRDSVSIVVGREKRGNNASIHATCFLGSSRERLSHVGSPVTLSPNRTDKFPSIGLSLYVSLKIFSLRERTSMELLMTELTEDECFPVSSCHQLLPLLFPMSSILEFANVMDFKCPFFPSSPLFPLLHIRLVLMCQRQEQTPSPKILKLAHFRLDLVRQGREVCQPSEFCLVGKKDFRIAEHRQFDFMSRSRGLVVPISLGTAELLKVAGWNVQLSSLGD